MTVARFEHIVDMMDVDTVQINFTRLFPLMGIGIETLLRDLGNPLPGIIATGHGMPVVGAHCEFRTPFGWGDVAVVSTAVTRLGRTSYSMTHKFERDGELCALGRTEHVHVAFTETPHRPLPLPQWIIDAYEPGFLDGVVTRA